MAIEDELAKGLGGQDWPDSVPAQVDQRPIDLLRPKSKEHERVLNYLLKRLKFSEEKMSAFYPRWRVTEKKLQAYIDLPDYEKELKALNDKGAPPNPVHIVVPYSYATIATIVTYLIHTFAGRKPMFQIGTYKAEFAQSARNMETVLQFNADHTRLIKHLFQFFQDGESYGLGVMRTQWKREEKLRTVWKPSLIGGKKERSRELRVTYEGNEVCSVDPFMFFPDPHVPMSEVNKKGEYVFWRSFDGKHTLKLMEARGELKYIDDAPPMSARNADQTGEQSVRNIIAGGESGPRMANAEDQKNWYQVDQGTCWIIPRELGLGDSELPELWVFTILNKAQIVQAEPLELDHGMHPVVVSEPYLLGYGFGHMGMADYLGPIQDIQSWFINSHLMNVRAALNNMFIYDPSKIEEQDLKKPGPGKRIRLKKAAYGQDVRSAMHQFQVADVTTNHIRDLDMFMRIGDTLSSITDNLRGIQDSGGRKTATEVRTAGEAAASRLASHARLISAQSITDLTEQMSLNNQQFLSEEFFLQVTGEDGRQAPIRIEPEMLVGDFNYPVHDGTLPLDRVAMLDVWKEILMGVMQDQELRSSYSIPKVFEYVAELGGARNIESFRVSAQPQEQIDANSALQQLGGGGPTPGVVPNPGARMANGPL